MIVPEEGSFSPGTNMVKGEILTGYPVPSAHAPTLILTRTFPKIAIIKKYSKIKNKITKTSYSILLKVDKNIYISTDSEQNGNHAYQSVN